MENVTEKNKSVGIELRALGNLMKRKFNNSSFVKDYPLLTARQGFVLEFLFCNVSNGRDVFQRDIEQRFEIRRSTATEMLNLMEKNGLIERQYVESDGRLKKIVPTSEAKDISKRVSNNVDKLENLLIDGISEEELKNFFTTLDKMKNNLAE